MKQGDIINNLDLLRLSLAILVIFAHSYALTLGTNANEPLYLFSGGQLTFGDFAVDVFFIISGYLVSRSWSNTGNIFKFLKKRFLRIYPAFIAASIFGLILARISVTPHKHSYIDPKILLWHLLTLKDFYLEGAFASNPFSGVINGSLWSISFEFWCYFGTAILGLSKLMDQRRAILALFLISWCISIVFAMLNLRIGGAGLISQIFGYPPIWARIMPFYLMGTLLFLYQDWFREFGDRLSMFAFWLVLVALSAPFGATVLMPFILGLLVYRISTARAIQSPQLKGDYSYGVYLYAFPVQQLLLCFWPQLSPGQLLVISLIPIFGMASFSWHLIESRCISRRPKAVDASLRKTV